MDSLPSLSPAQQLRPPGFLPETQVFTGDMEADGLIHQLIQEGSWSPLDYNAIGTLDPIPPGFLLDASSLLSDLMSCLTAAPDTLGNVETENRVEAELSIAPLATQVMNQGESPRPEAPPAVRVTTPKPKPSPRPAKTPSRRNRPH